MMSKTEQFLREQSDITKLVSKLDVDEIDIITAAKEQPGLYIKAARYRVQKMRRRIRMESEFDTVRTDLALRIRAKEKLNPSKTKKPMTETHLKELLLRNTV